MPERDPTCTYCPAPAEVTDGAERFCACCALTAAYILALELREAWREGVEA